MKPAIYEQRTRPLDIHAASIDRTPRAERAMQHCRDEWQRAYDTSIRNGKTTAQAIRIGAVAYKLAMPGL
ncbi:MAG: hypothetical protein WCA37_12330, partial [Terracidiphilus sp.]